MNSLGRIVIGMILGAGFGFFISMLPALLIHHGSILFSILKAMGFFAIIGGMIGYFLRSHIDPVTNEMRPPSEIGLSIIIMIFLSPFLLAYLWYIYLRLGDYFDFDMSFGGFLLSLFLIILIGLIVRYILCHGFNNALTRFLKLLRYSKFFHYILIFIIIIPPFIYLVPVFYKLFH